jgi:hypothetical protein
VWGWVVVTFFTWFVGFAMAEICSSFPVRPTHDSSLPADHVPPLFAILAFYAGFEPALGMQFCVTINYYFLTHFHGRQQDPCTSGQLIWLGLDGGHWRPGSVHGLGWLVWLPELAHRCKILNSLIRSQLCNALWNPHGLKEIWVKRSTCKQTIRKFSSIVTRNMTCRIKFSSPHTKEGTRLSGHSESAWTDIMWVLWIWGLCRNRDLAEHNSVVHTYKWAWWLLCSTWSVSCNLYCTLHHMGHAQHMCNQCNSYHWYSIYILAGKYDQPHHVYGTCYHIYLKHPAFKGSDNAICILRNTHVMLEKTFPILKNPLQLPVD